MIDVAIIAASVTPYTLRQGVTPTTWNDRPKKFKMRFTGKTLARQFGADVD
jgi:hypothetical protein